MCTKGVFNFYLVVVCLMGMSASAAEAPVLNPKADALYSEIQKYYRQGSYDVAITKMEEYERDNPAGNEIGNVQNLHGLALLAIKRPAQAIPYFKQALEKQGGSDIFKNSLLFNIAACQFEALQVKESQSTLEDIKPKVLDRDVRVKFYGLKSRVLRALGQVDKSLAALVQMSTEADAKVIKIYQIEVDQRLSEIKDADAIGSILSEFPDSPYSDRLSVRLATLAIQANDYEKALKRLKTAKEKFLGTELGPLIDQLIGDLEHQNIQEPNSVGVLLPLTGRFSNIGRKALQAIELAFRILDDDSKVTLFVQDSGEDPQTAIRGLYTLAVRNRVSAILGPLPSKGIDQIAKVAAEIGVPLLSLSQAQPENPGDGYIGAGMTLKFQAQEMAKFAISKMGLKRFAIVYPRDRFGEQMVNLFWDAVEAEGGRVTDVESYSSGETDFRQVIDKIAGLFYPDSRQRELDALAEARKAKDIKKKTRKTEALFNLPPIVDFDAVFIPDEPKVLGQILPTFAYRDVDKVSFLGPSTWNSPELVQRAQNFAEGSVFGDLFFAESSHPSVKKFSARYKAAFGTVPSSVEASAYEAALVLEKAFLTGNDSRASVQRALNSISDFPSMSGKITVKDHMFSRPLTFLTVKNSTIKEWKPLNQ